MGRCSYYHRHHIEHFLSDVQDKPNRLLKRCEQLIADPVALAGCKVLGLLSKLVTSPLWRVIESTNHVLDMNTHYDNLLTYFNRASDDASEFVAGSWSPFSESLVKSDHILDCLKEANECIDDIAVQMSQTLFVAFSQLLKRAMPEQLEGGLYSEANDEELRKSTVSVKPHNKDPESIFGMLDFLMRYHPVASTLANEALLLYSYNKSSAWLQSKSESEKNRLVSQARNKGKQLRQRFLARKDELCKKRLAAQREKEDLIRQKKLKDQQRAEQLTVEISYFGLWQKVGEVDCKLAEISSKAEKRRALSAQLQFRRYVLKQEVQDKSIFFMSKGGKQLETEIVVENLKKLIGDAFESGPNTEGMSNLKMLLVGKTVSHTFENDSYDGYVIGVVPGFPAYYNIVYFENGEKTISEVDVDNTPVYTFRLQDDYRDGNLSIKF